MSKEREESICINIGRIRIRRSLNRERKDSNILSIEITQIKINQTNLLRMNLKENTREKGEYHQSNVGDAKRITYTRISLT
jgi:hypothetical protein